MFDELRKSISAILYERTTSPLFGTFVFSWSIWNWKIIYLTAFVSEDKIPVNKIDYILQYFWNWNHLFWLPLFSTIILLTVVPFVSNGAYWLSIKFENWKLEKKREIEKTHTLTLEQSIAMKEEILKQQKRIELLNSDKDLEIKQLENLIQSKDSEIEELMVEIQKKPQSQSEDSDIEEMFTIITNNKKYLEHFTNIPGHIRQGYPLSSNVDGYLLGLLESGGYLSEGTHGYRFTDNGNKLLNKVLKNTAEII